MRILFFLLILPFAFSVFAEEEMSAFQKFIKNEQLIETKESQVMINGVEYRKIEYEGRSYFFSAKQRQGELPVYYCNGVSSNSGEHLITGSVKIKRRKALYLSLVKDKCEVKDNGQKKEFVSVSPEIGIHLFNDKNDLVKNKKIGLDVESLLLGAPFLNFSGDF